MATVYDWQKTNSGVLQTTWMGIAMRGCDMEKPGQTSWIRRQPAYQPLYISGNKYLKHKWDKAWYDLHRSKVKSAKPTVNMSPPKIYPHLIHKMKKKQIEQERAMKIQRENNILLEKISHIMRTTGGVDTGNYYFKKKDSKNIKACSEGDRREKTSADATTVGKSRGRGR